MKLIHIIIMLSCMVGSVQMAGALVEVTGNVYLDEPIVVRDDTLWIHDAVIDGGNGSVYICAMRSKVRMVNSTFKNMGIPEPKKHGVSLYHVDHALIDNCTFTNLYRGIHVQNCTNINILNCYFSNNSDYGVNIHGSLILGWSSRYVTLENCTSVNNGHHGITFSQNIFNSTVAFCTIYNNRNSGLILDQSSNHNSVHDNVIRKNGDYGIAIYDSYENDIRHNDISGNGRSAIFNRDRRYKIRSVHVMLLAILLSILISCRKRDGA